MSEFTNSLGNQNDIKDFVYDIETVFCLLQMAMNENNYAALDLAINRSSDCIKKYRYLKIKEKDQIEQIVGSIKQCRQGATTDGATRNYISEKIDKLKSLIGKMTEKYGSIQQEDEMSRLWNAELNGIIKLASELKKETPDRTVLSRLRMIYEELEYQVVSRRKVQGRGEETPGLE